MEIVQIVPKRRVTKIEDILQIGSTQFGFKVFDQRIINFGNELSKLILRDKSLRSIPAYVALGFWLRRSNLQSIVENNSKKGPNVHLSPLGVVFHVCPSNVDTMFIYSLFVALLAGNQNILRISRRLEDESLNRLFLHINSVLNLEAYADLAQYISVITYDRDEEINRLIAKHVDARIIWGGDETIKHISSICENPRSKDLAFADRRSMTIINTDFFLDQSDVEKQRFAKSFFNDTFTFDQKGCASPETIFTIGSVSSHDEFIRQFYPILLSEISDSYIYDPASLACLKLNQLAIDAIDNKISSHYSTDQSLVFANLDSNLSGLDHGCGGGYFYVKNLDELENLHNYLDRKIQTMTYYGISDEEKDQILELSQGSGIDRIVPVGIALDFHYIWDGYNLLEELVRKKFVV